MTFWDDCHCCCISGNLKGKKTLDGFVTDFGQWESLHCNTQSKWRWRGASWLVCTSIKQRLRAPPPCIYEPKDAGPAIFFPFLFLMQNSLPVVYEMMHFVFLLPLLPRKHLNPLMSQFRAHFVSSNAHSLPDVLGCRNPLKIARKDKLQPELIHHVKRHMYCNFCEHGFATRLIITSNEDGFHFCRCCTLWFNSPASEEAEQKLR